jgi:hypothetical protein
MKATRSVKGHDHLVPKFLQPVSHPGVMTMDITSALALASLLALAIVARVVRTARGRPLLRRWIQSLAKDRSGTMLVRSRWSRPAFRFQIADDPWLFESLKIGKQDGLQLSTHWPDRAPCLLTCTTGTYHVVSDNEPARDDVSVFTAERRSEQFVFRGNDQQALSRYAVSPVAWHLERLHQAPVVSDVWLIVRDGMLLVRKAGPFQAASQVGEFLAQAIALSEAFQLAQPAGIEFSESTLARQPERAKCPVCSEPLGPTDPRALRTCVRCGTRHHRECWELAGRCAIYGCGETRGESSVIPAVPDARVVSDDARSTDNASSAAKRRQP